MWILLKQETVSGSGISWAVCKSTSHSRQITTPAPHHSVFYRPDALPATQPTVSKHWRPGLGKLKKSTTFKDFPGNVETVSPVSGMQLSEWVSSHLSSDDVPWQKLNSQTPERLTANEFVIGGRHQWTQSADSIRQLALRQHSAAMHRTHSKHHANTTLGKDVLPSVLWRCWLGSRKGIRPVKNWVWSAGVVLSEARCRLAYGPADATRCLLLQ